MDLNYNSYNEVFKIHNNDLDDVIEWCKDTFGMDNYDNLWKYDSGGNYIVIMDHHLAVLYTLKWT